MFNFSSIWKWIYVIGDFLYKNDSVYFSKDIQSFNSLFFFFIWE